jgi:hypothetical protein
MNCPNTHRDERDDLLRDASIVVLRFEESHLSRIPCRLSSADVKSSGFSLFATLKEIVKHREIQSIAAPSAEMSIPCEARNARGAHATGSRADAMVSARRDNQE